MNRARSAERRALFSRVPLHEHAVPIFHIGRIRRVQVFFDGEQRSGAYFDTIPVGYNPGFTPKTSSLSPGQVTQPTEMIKTMTDADPAARRVFQEADDALGFAISRVCFEGPDDQLKLTEN